VEFLGVCDKVNAALITVAEEAEAVYILHTLASKLFKLNLTSIAQGESSGRARQREAPVEPKPARRSRLPRRSRLWRDHPCNTSDFQVAKNARQEPRPPGMGQMILPGVAAPSLWRASVGARIVELRGEPRSVPYHELAWGGGESN
jgi:hypothetical protein